MVHGKVNDKKVNEWWDWDWGPGAITKLKRNGRWTMDKFQSWDFSYWKIDVQRRTLSNFGDFFCSYHEIITVWILALEGRDKKGRFLETNLSEYSISKTKMQGIFESGLASHRIK